MANNEHRDEEKYESVELTVDQWKQVIEKAGNSEKSDLHMYVLRSWANQQSVSNASICAFRSIVVEDIRDRRVGYRKLKLFLTSSLIDFSEVTSFYVELNREKTFQLLQALAQEPRI